MTRTFQLNGNSTRLAIIAAVVNGFVFASMPLLMMLVAITFAPSSSDTSTTVRPAGALPLPVVALSTWMQMWKVLLPLAMIAGWRTFVHASGRLTGDDHSWRGVFEAGLCGFLCVLVILARGIMTHPTQAPPYILVYGGLGLIVGVTVGLVLRTTAVLFLRLSRRGAAY